MRSMEATGRAGSETKERYVKSFGLPVTVTAVGLFGQARHTPVKEPLHESVLMYDI